MAFQFTAGERHVFARQPYVPLSEWAARNLIVRDGPHAGGRYRRDVNPYLVGIMDAWSAPGVEEVVVCGSAQTGKTLVMHAALCYCVARRPGPRMLAMQDDDAMGKVAQLKLLPMFRSSPGVRGMLGKVRAQRIGFRDGTSLFLASAQSPGQRASISIQDLFLDEEALYKQIAGQGVPVAEFKERTRSYARKRKILRVSKPIGGEECSIAQALSEMDELRHRIMQLEIEEAAMKKETDKLTQAHLAEVQKELAELREQFNGMKARWENEKQSIGKVQNLRQEIEKINAEIEMAQNRYDLNKAAELKYGKLPQLQKELEEAEKTSETEEKEDTLLRDKVTEEEISRIVARWTGIPVAKLMEGEREKLLHLEDILHRRVIGQDEAVTKVSDAILRSRAGIRDPKRPIGSFLFLGPTGVGKTELAKALAEALFDDEHNIVRIDMSEYMEKYSVSRLIGAPPGYVGYEEGGQLTEAVRRRPYSVVLFDEVEKAHPDVFNVLLQVLDDGRITDSQGRTVDFKNTIIILTSNLGSDLILEGIGENGEISEEARDGVTQLLRRSFRPEFLNRLDEIVFYKPLTKENIRGIVDLLVADLQKRMAQRQLTVTLTDAAKDYLIAKGYDPIYGARPLKRLIQTEVETLLARWIIAEDPAPETAITVDYDGEKLVAM